VIIRQIVVVVFLFVIQPIYARVLTVTNSFDGGVGSLRHLILNAQYADTIIFASAIDSVVILFAPIFFNDNHRLTLDGGVKGCKIVGLTGDAVFIARNQTDTLRFKNIAWRGARKPNIVSKSKLYVEHCDFADHTGGSGAALFPDTSDIYVVNSSFRHNRAFGLGQSRLSGEGAAITGHRAFVKLVNCTFYDNIAGQGGALAADNGTDYEILHCTFAFNAGTVNNGVRLGNGGAILANGDTVKLYNSILTENTDNQIAKIPGYILGSHNLILQDSTFTAFQIRKKAGLAPIQTDGIVWFFPLQLGSPAINTALPTYATSADIRGKARQKPDLGSYEFILCENPTIQAMRIIDSVCSPSQITFQPQLGDFQANIAQLTWTATNLAGLQNIALQQQSFTVNNPQLFQTYQIEANINFQFDSQTCIYTQPISIKVLPLPPKRLTDTVLFCPDVTPFANLDAFRPDSTIERYLWQPTRQQQGNIRTNQEGSYTVTIRNKYGCQSIETTTVVAFCEPETFFPNVFYPDSFIPEHRIFKPIKTNLRNYKLVVYNRWGDIMFATTNPAEGWDGTHNNYPQPQGYYTFHAQLQTDIIGSMRYYNGTIFLMRK